jgi:uncharacterized protein
VSATGHRPWTVGPDGIVVAVRPTPKGGRDALDGIEEMVDGRPVLKARSLAVAPRDVSATTRLKRREIVGHGAALAATLADIVEAPRP